MSAIPSQALCGFYQRTLKCCHSRAGGNPKIRHWIRDQCRQLETAWPRCYRDVAMKPGDAEACESPGADVADHSLARQYPFFFRSGPLAL